MRNVLARVQTRLTYHHPSGMRRMRVATKATYWAEPNTSPQALGFSATTAAVVFARWLAYEASRGASARELSTWLDRQLVSLTQRAATFKDGDATSVVLPGELSSLPELVFHMRRSTFLNYFGNAPDETVFHRSLLFRCEPAILFLSLQVSSQWNTMCMAQWGYQAELSRHIDPVGPPV